MKTTRIKISILMIILCGLLVTSVDAQKTHRKYQKIQKQMDEATSNHLSGVVVYIQSEKYGSWTGVSGYSDLENKKTIKKQDIFSLASIGKTYAAVAVLKLVEDGTLGLDDPIKNYLPQEIIQGIVNTEEVTIRHLLSHTSGFCNYNANPELNELYLSGNLKLDTLSHMDALRRYAYGERPDTKPLGTYSYSSTNYLLLTMIMDSIFPQGHEAYLREEIIAKYDFGNTYYKQTPTKNLVKHYGDLNKDTKLENLSEETIETTNWYSGDDGIYANAEDAGDFLKKLMDGEIIKDSTLKEMTTWVNEKYLDYGLGLMAGKGFPYKISMGHSGRGIGVTTELYYFPKQDMVIAILCNTGLRSGSLEVKDDYYKLRNGIIEKMFLL